MILSCRITNATRLGVNTPVQVDISEIQPGNEFFNPLEGSPAILVQARHCQECYLAMYFTTFVPSFHFPAHLPRGNRRVVNNEPPSHWSYHAALKPVSATASTFNSNFKKVFNAIASIINSSENIFNTPKRNDVTLINSF